MSQCKNCNEELKGDYCFKCGQDTGSPIRNVFGVVGEYLGETGNFDGRFWRTMIPLFIRPAFLSNEYVQDRRVPYVPPLRLYIFISIFALIILNAFVDTIQIENSGSFKTPEEARQELIEQGLSAEQIEEVESDTELFEGEENLYIPILGEVDKDALNNRLAMFAENPRLLFHKFLSVAPQLMFVLLPIFAMFLKLMYWRSQRYYMEHLVLTLHVHAILLLMTSLLALNGIFLFGLEKLWGEGWWLQSMSSINVVILLWMPIYVLLAQKYFYRQGWFKTVVKYLISGSIWSVLMACLVLVAIVRTVLFD